MGTANGCFVLIPIPDVARRRRELLEEHFAPQERREAEALPDRTVAGRLAVKEATAGLLRERGWTISPSAVILGRGEGGAPLLLGLPAAVGAGRRILISISHTRDHACGLAVLEDDGGR
jgi:phosphopantetheinyl transferase (holo-ACP synthase)